MSVSDLHDRGRSPRKAQSAMEYMVTYGWVILLAALVLSALYALGVFNSSGLTHTSCIPVSGFSCGTPIMNTSGYLATNLSQINVQAQSLTITGAGCSSNSTEPSAFLSVSNTILVSSGNSSTVLFQCALSRQGALGASFSGTLWIKYNSGSQTGTVEEVGTVTASASTAAPLVLPAVLAYVPITLINSQSTATGAGFQVEINIGSTNCGSCATYETSGLTNVEFSTSPNGGGTVLYSWIEANASSSASSTQAWVNLGTSSIGASSSLTIYMDMMKKAVMGGTASYTGEAPQLSPTYGQYDNGGKVFGFYDNFTGTSLSSAWTFNNELGSDSVGGTYSVNNDLVLTSSSTGWGGPLVYTTGTYSPGIAEADILANGGGGNTGVWIGYSLGGPCASGSQGMSSAYDARDTIWAGAWNIDYIPSGASSCSYSFLTSPGEPATGIFGDAWPATGSEVMYYNEQSVSTASNTALAWGSSHILFYYSYQGSATIQWVRTRQYPPNGAPPMVSFGSIVTG